MMNAIVLAAGKGSRFKSQDPLFNKCLVPILDEPALSYLVTALFNAKVEKRFIVVSEDSPIKKTFENENFVIQKEALGTGHAVQQCLAVLEKSGKTLILPGDCPTITSQVITNLIQEHDKYGSDITFLTMKINPDSKYGKIVLDKDGRVAKIVEKKDATAKEKRIDIGNSGVYLINNELLFKYIPLISNDNLQKEYYLTDIILLAINDKKVVRTHEVAPEYVMAFNDRIELEVVRQIISRRINEEWMLKGVTIENPEDVIIGPHVVLLPDTKLTGGVKILGTSRIGMNNAITGASYLKNASVGNDNKIESSNINDTTIGDKNQIGPFARLRGKTKIHENCRIGKFVEFKNVVFRSESKCAHLTYLGDADVGKDVNIGCGVVTANYDRVNKWRTTIGDRAFIGSNSVIIAPVTIETNGFIAAGSTITTNVKENDMAIARSAQINYENYSNVLMERALKKAKK
ncbi:MAG: bifunctional UDP-N-acetylglucosamine diphosphorylase/glucosamine-1-phosphate N-acetyltransferase GlmU [Erysipelotrichaceae bacterium]|jgi:bifunctional UDP-N-acetylglucosamine pyrophosphorylase/glucosamine-1-phosphate N-acetyltransferase|nr:bifunctional UDP-N-acetylglucosamine diphosphorylase/glucosamine-1-phosphate N-acetyltransferase GlmU [Erysipelotrichaceae bacterium]